ncbi:MAG: excinuclease ABC subunit UvrC [Paludibacteraceae bacterium]|nr:excinuclease ABC subunit UvrC [Paludibacteraceae bacterium]
MIETSRHIKEILQRLPEKPGVYQHLNKEGEIIYVGKAKNLKRRVTSYFQKEHDWVKTRQLVKNIADIKYVVVDTEQDAFLLENNLIKQYQPRYNILLKDGKSYPYICISKEAYPRIYKTRKRIKGAGEYFGPYSYGNTVDLVIELIHQLYPIRTCNLNLVDSSIVKKKYKVCLKYHLHLCCGVCADRIKKEEYNNYIDQAKKIIRGDAHTISKQWEREMMEYASQMKFEQAQEIKEKLELIEKFRSKTVITNNHTGELDVFGYDEQDQNIYVSMLHIRNGSIVQGQTLEYHKQLDEAKEELLGIGMMELRERLNSNTQDVIVPFIPDGFDENLHIHIAPSGEKKILLDLAMKNVRQYKLDRLKQNDKLNPDQRAARILGELQKLLELEKMPALIDSFDNSHIQGSDAVGGCVVFRKAKPAKSEYKHYIIHDSRSSYIDDLASMREVVRRRYQDILDNNGELPDLIIADGGSNQMNAIREVVEKQLGLNIPIAGLKKDDKHRTNVLLYGSPVKEIGLKVTDEAFHLLVEIQDEVHRWAISFHQLRRSKHQIKSELDDIQGVGPATKQKILTYFKSIKRASSANKDEWVKLLGTNRGSACYEYFQSKITR